jgi:hypothetical protein
MKRCSDCNVLVESGTTCPLCGNDLVEETDATPTAAPRPESPHSPANGQDEQAAPRSGNEPATSSSATDSASTGAGAPESDATTIRHARIWVFEMVSLVAFTALIIVFASDFAFGFAVTWSRYPLLAVGFVYLFTIAIVGFGETPALLLVSETVVISLFLLGLDLMLPGSGWFMQYALPITLLVSLAIGLIAAAATGLKLNSLQTLSVVFLGSGGFVVGVEIVLNLARGAESLVSWSLVALACCISISLLIFFINKRLRERHAEFRKIFHL